MGRDRWRRVCGWWAATAAGAAIGVTIWLLWGTANQAAAGADRARIRIEAVRTGLAAGAGAGAAVALLLSFRRQAHTEYDTAERRVTELHNAAAEQLGSDKAPVRLTALYTLERLAGDNVQHQQTIVNIICAYLRMPYDPPRTTGRAARRRVARADLTGTVPAAPDPREEHQVRLTAQRSLTAHLHPEASTHWTNNYLDLTGATLTDFDLLGCTLHSASFRGATFTGPADYRDATFAGPADFRKTTFASLASFRETTFTRLASFSRARVTDVDYLHVFPAGWRVEPTGGIGGRLVRVEGGGRGEADQGDVAGSEG